MLWAHAECQNISKELYACLRNPGKVGGVVLWQCDSCVAASSGLDARVTALETDIGKMEARIIRNEGSVQEATKRVDKVEARQGKVEERMENERERIRMERVVEMRERELRKKNVVIHRMMEADKELVNADERREWDMASCANLFKELDLEWGREVIRFCRRIGEKSDEPRPMIVGFKREWQKEDLMDKAKELRDTAFPEVGIMPDLTQEQRRDEADMSKEAENRNANRTTEEKAKNLVWMVVGRKGEKRLVKGVERGGGSGWRGTARGGGSERGGQLPARGMRGAWGPGALRGQVARGMTNGYTGRGTGRENLLQLVRGGAQQRARINSKRTRGAEGEEEEMDDREQPPQPGGSQMAN